MNITTTSFASILDASPDHVELPKALPEGSYRGVVGAAMYDKSKQKATPFVRWPITSIQPVEPPKSMNEDEWLEAIEVAGGTDDKTMDHTIYLTEKNAFRLDQFHQHCGLDLHIAASRRARNEQVMNYEVGFIIEHQTPEGADADDPETPRYARIARTFALDE